MGKRVDWDWESQLTPGEIEQLDAIAIKENNLNILFNKLTQDSEELRIARRLIILATTKRARTAGVKKTPFKL